MDHPVLCKRGGHNDVLNSYGLHLCGITRDTPSPEGGTIVHDDDGNPTGWLIDTAISLAERFLTPPPRDAQVEGIRRASLGYAENGLGSVRDPAVEPDELLLLQDAWKRGALAVQVRPMLLVGFAQATNSLADLLGQIDDWQTQRNVGDDWLRLWGLKIVLDGGAENAALEQPYANRPDFTGSLQWDPDELFRVLDHAVRRRWKVGTHAWGDRAVRTILDVYDRVLAANPGLPAGTLVLEHGGLAPAVQRARAIRLGIPVTVQHPLLHDLAPALVENFGAARTGEIFPLREWLAEGALLAAGSDYPVGPYNPMRSVWGMVTRQTAAGVLGPEHAIDPYTAVRLYTADAARLVGEADGLGTIEPGRLADLVAYRSDPITCAVADLPSLQPAFTMVGGRAVYDPAGLFERHA
jgi:predicted amidohydrolase YtcJ